MRHRFTVLRYKDNDYTLDTVNGNMTVFDEQPGDEIIVNESEAKEILANGEVILGGSEQGDTELGDTKPQNKEQSR